MPRYRDRKKAGGVDFPGPNVTQHELASVYCVGYARAKITSPPGLRCGAADDCRTTYRRYNALYVSSVFGWLSHPGGAVGEVGPIVRLDIVDDPRARISADYAVTLGGELGLRIARTKPNLPVAVRASARDA